MSNRPRNPSSLSSIAIRNPIVPIVSTLKEHEIPKAVHKLVDPVLTNLKTTIEVPYFKDGSKEFILHFLSLFDRACESFQYNTGPQKYRFFQNHLQGPAYDLWTGIVGDDDDGDVDAFNDHRKDFLSHYFAQTDFLKMKNYIKSVKKPIKMSPQTFIQRVVTLNRYLEFIALDTAYSSIHEEELKELIVNAMPTSWRAAYIRAGKSVIIDSLPNITAYMTEQHSLELELNLGPSSNRNNHNHQQNRSNNGNSSNNRGSQQCRTHPNSNHTWAECRLNPRNQNNSSNNQHNNNRQSCPRHPDSNHSWADCRQNPRNQQQNSNSSNNNSSNRSSSSRHNGSHNQQRNSNSYGNRNGNNNRSNNNRPRFNNNNGDAHFTDSSPGHRDNVPFATSVPFDDEPVFESHLNENYSIVVPQPTTASNHSPAALTRIASIGHVDTSKTVFVSLMDSGGTHIMLNSRILPANHRTKAIPPQTFRTILGDMHSNTCIALGNISFPEFSPSATYRNQVAFVFHEPQCPYDIIVGRNLQAEMRIVLDMGALSMRIDHITVPFKPKSFWQPPNRQLALQSFLHPDPPVVEALLNEITPGDSLIVDASPAPLTLSSYKQSTRAELEAKCVHLPPDQRNQVVNVLSSFLTTLFSGRLGQYARRTIHIHVDPKAKPFHAKAYPVARIHEDLFKQELKRLCELKVIERTHESFWASPAFITPKKDGSARFVTDFRVLNRSIIRKIYPLPKITDIITRRSSYLFVTILDVSMQYWTFVLDRSSSEICTIITPFGKFRYLRLPMGVCPSAHIAQAIMEHELQDLPYVEVYIDDIAIFSNSFTDHLQHVTATLQRLRDANFTVNPNKCTWFAKEAQFLGYVLTPHGFKPQRSKIDALLKIKPPTNTSECRAFCSLVTFYRDLFPRRAHLLAPLTDLNGKKTFLWTPTHQQAFDQIKSLIAQDTLLRYPDSSLPFHVYADASKLQLGGIIKQNNLPVAFYSRKLTPTQQRYTVSEKELLSIVETLKEFRPILLGSDLHIHTDHRNLIYDKPPENDRVYRWRTLVENFHPTLHFISGSTNSQADALSRLPISDAPTATLTPEYPDAFLFYPDVDQSNDFVYPLDLVLLRDQQQLDQDLLQRRAQALDCHPYIAFSTDATLICHRPTPTAPYRICIPQSLLDPIIRWYHMMLSHAGPERTCRTIATHFFYPSLKEHVTTRLRSCDPCQRYKQLGRGYGELPPRNAPIAPWESVCLDLAGPWDFEHANRTFTFHTLTCIDPVTGLAEIVPVHDKTGLHIAHLFEVHWLARYPRPLFCVHDRGSEFVNHDFLKLLALNGIRPRPTSTKNPQANSIAERLHQVMLGGLRTYVNTRPPPNHMAILTYVESVCATISYSVRAAHNRSLRTSPGAFVFKRDMFLPLPVHVDLAILHQHRQRLIDENARRANLRRFSYDYEVGDEILLFDSRDHIPKLNARVTGPYVIHQIHANGTVTIKKGNFSFDRVNIRRIKPYRRNEIVPEDSDAPT